MSRYKGNGEACSTCGITYARFRTGFSWGEIWLMFWTSEDTPREEWKRKSRGIILGRWHEIKQDMWAHHLDECERTGAKAS